jgi:hypothetical protein
LARLNSIVQLIDVEPFASIATAKTVLTKGRLRKETAATIKRMAFVLLDGFEYTTKNQAIEAIIESL